MEPFSRNVWKQLSKLFPPNAEQASIAADLFREYESHGFLSESLGALADLPLAVIADFFRRTSLMHSIESPVLRRRDTRWMSEFDYSLINVRAASGEGGRGTFLSTSMILATLRVRAVIVAPVTKGPGADLNNLSSHAVLREELIDTQALSAGIGPEMQMAAFAEAAHLLGLALGCDLDYRVHPLAAVVVNKPELFLWKKTGEDAPKEEAGQEALQGRVREIVSSLHQAGSAIDSQRISEALVAEGLEVVLATDHSGRTALSFRNLDDGSHRENAVSYWGRVFDLWRDRYGFDFLFLRGTFEPNDDQPEIPDRALVRRAADAARKSGVRRNVGVMAEAKALDVESYGIQGVDLVVDDDRLSKVDRDWLDRAFLLDERLRRVNLGRKLRFSIPVVVDPGEKDSKPRRERALMKRFVARFLGTGPSRRPLLETMGAMEGAWGYGAALQEKRSLGWSPDAKDEAMARTLEDLAARYREYLTQGERLDKHLGDRVAWWVIRSRRGLLIAMVSVENEDLLPPEPFSIDYGNYLKDHQVLTVLEHDFHGDRGNLLLNSGTRIDTGAIPYRGFRLYVVS